MGLNLEYIDGQTPIDEEEKEELLIPTITTRAELDEFEQQNIEEALQFVFGKSFKKENVFTEEFVKKLHERMYGSVWKWAGKFRKTNKNIGVDKWQIALALKRLLDGKTGSAEKPGAGGYREHDILIITEDGNEDITKYPYGPDFNIVG